MQNAKLKNKIYTNLFLIMLTFVPFYFLALPIYNGGGQNLLGINKTIVSLLQEKDNYNSAIKDAEKYRVTINNVLSAYSTVSDGGKMVGVESMIPSNADPVAVINELSYITLQSNMQLTSPRFADDSENNQNSYNTLTIDFSVKGTYPDLKSLLHNIENSQRIYNVKKMSFSSSADTKATSILTYQISVETYYLKNK